MREREKQKDEREKQNDESEIQRQRLELDRQRHELERREREAAIAKDQAMSPSSVAEREEGTMTSMYI